MQRAVSYEYGRSNPSARCLPADLGPGTQRTRRREDRRTPDRGAPLRQRGESGSSLCARDTAPGYRSARASRERFQSRRWPHSSALAWHAAESTHSNSRLLSTLEASTGRMVADSSPQRMQARPSSWASLRCAGRCGTWRRSLARTPPGGARSQGPARAQSRSVTACLRPLCR
jgi:hypothetical protein